MTFLKREQLKFILLNLALLAFLQPGSIAFANFDAPYGFLKDLSAWLEAYVGAMPLVLIYAFWNREKLGKKLITGYLVFAALLISFAYHISKLAFAGVNSNFSFTDFLILCPISTLLALMFLIPSLMYIYRLYYSYDWPLVIVEILVALATFLVYTKLREEVKSYL
ncbi:hypothetical protein E3E31_03520 [Thermococcus sp. M39]|uniref:hypothetical protein n=1 Tax=unclassified Thermococcus TaxID=2627626 RepID=UPI00143C84FD|nr:MULTISPECIES: hypothetical protein [unclassified Thermococcus]NJE07600.1 hypothetical protein [Thermococcus sp. M39]NJE12184.1 hypothetical protein [Thermococcus sp. LS2]